MLLQFSRNREEAYLRFQQFVAEGVGQSLWNQLRQQVFLGDERFVEQQLKIAEEKGTKLTEVPHRQKQPPAKPLSCYQEEASSRNFGVHSSTVSRVVARSKAVEQV